MFELPLGHDNLASDTAAAVLGPEAVNEEEPRSQQKEVQQRFLEDAFHLHGVYQIGEV